MNWTTTLAGREQTYPRTYDANVASIQPSMCYATSYQPQHDSDCWYDGKYDGHGQEGNLPVLLEWYHLHPDSGFHCQRLVESDLGRGVVGGSLTPSLDYVL